MHGEFAVQAKGSEPEQGRRLDLRNDDEVEFLLGDQPPDVSDQIHAPALRANDLGVTSLGIDDLFICGREKDMDMQLIAKTSGHFVA